MGRLFLGHEADSLHLHHIGGAVRRDAVAGKYRIWGSGDFTHWGNYDPQRPGKTVGFFLDVGGRVIPFVTPDDPDAFEQALRPHVPVRSPL